MAKLTLYHIPLFRSTRVKWLLCELQHVYSAHQLPKIEYHEFDPDTFREHKPEWFLRLNPNGKVPTLVHDLGTGEKPVIMFESCAICLYLLQQFDREENLAPMSNSRYAALMYQMCLYVGGTLDSLTATSSIIQLALEDKRPGDDKEFQQVNHRAWCDFIGPYISSLIMEGKGFAWEGRFTALDAILGYSMIRMEQKRGWLSNGFPDLHKYARQMNERPACMEAFAPFHSGKL